MGIYVEKFKKKEGDPCPVCHSTDRKDTPKGTLELRGVGVFSLACPVCNYKVHPRQTYENTLSPEVKARIRSRISMAKHIRQKKEGTLQKRRIARNVQNGGNKVPGRGIKAKSAVSLI